jgi:O-antigen ligase
LSPLFRGYYPLSAWGPVTLVFLAILLALVFSRPEAPRGPAAFALVGLALLCAWSYLSIGWSESPDGALSEAGRWLLYTAAFAVFLLLLRTRFDASVLLAVAASGVLVVGLYVVVTMIAGDGPGLFFRGRLNDPVGYVNGEAGVLLMGLWPLAAVAERRHPWLSPTAIAGATLLASLLVLSQARGVAFAAAVSGVALLLVVPGRAARLWVLLLILAGVGVALGPLLDVYNGGAAGPLSESIVRRAGYSALAGATIAGMLWAIAIQAEHAISRRSPASRRLLGRAGRIALVVALVVGVGAAVAFGGAIARGVDRNVHAFVHLNANQGSSRFLSGGGHRYDYWRIALDEFRDHPIRGVGAGGYGPGYFVARRTNEDIRQPHSVELQTLAELGLVGAAALALALLALLAGFVRLARIGRAGLWERTAAVAAGGAFLAWLAQTSVDWLHLLPGVTGIALAAASVLCAPWLRRDAWAIDSRAAAVAAAAVVALVAVAGALAVARPVLADHALSQARRQLRSDPRSALHNANEALTLNRYDLSAYYLKAATYARFDDYASARAVLLQAVRREPRNFLTFALLGDLATRRGDRRLATAEYRRAARLNPRDQVLARLPGQPAGR